MQTNSIEIVKTVQKLYEDLASAYQELAETLLTQKMFEKFWYDQLEKTQKLTEENNKLRQKISNLENPSKIKIFTLKQ